MDVNEAVVSQLKTHDVTTIFGIPGEQTLPLNQAIEATDDMRHITIRHETAASHQAWGYAQSSDRMAATLVIPGPGDMNAMNGLKNALNDCTPLLHLSVETDPEIRGGDGIHETPPDTYDNVVKENILVKHPESTVADVVRGITIAQTPPKGPVRVGIPKSFLRTDSEIAEFAELTPPDRSTLPSRKINRAVELLENATNPLIFAGGGVRSANVTDELTTCATLLDAPVVTTRKGKGVIPEDHGLSVGTLTVTTPALEQCIEESDVALAVGTDFDAVTTNTWTVPLPEELIHITLDTDDMGTGYDSTVGILADAKAVLTELTTRLTDNSGQRDGVARANNVNEAKHDRLEELRVTSSPLTSVSVIETVRDATPRDAVITADAGGLRVWMLTAMEAYDLQSYVNPGSWASMGTAYPAAIGAKAANPDRDVVALVGDGGFMMCVHELHTAVSENIPVIAIVCNNSDYAIISNSAEREYHLEEGTFAWDETPVTFTTVAEGMGMESTRVHTTSELDDAVSDSLGATTPTLIEVMTDPNEPQAGDWMTTLAE